MSKSNFKLEVGDEVSDWQGVIFTIKSFDDDKGTELVGGSGGRVWRCSSELELTTSCKANKCIQGYEGLLTKIEKLENLVESFELEEKDKCVPFWKQVFNQTEFYNGNGQMEISEMELSSIQKLIDDLSKNCGCIEDIFYLQMFSEVDGRWCGSIYQDMGGSGKLWLHIEDIIID